MTPTVRTHSALSGPGIDRAAGERTESGLLERLRSDAASRVLVLHGDAAPLSDPRARDGAPVHPALHFVAPDAAPADAEWAFLGRDPHGAAVLSATVASDAPAPFPAPAGWGSLRTVGGELSSLEASVFVEALSLGRWLLDAPFCPACGTRTIVRSAGWARHCPACGREHFPRTDPAVIVAVTSAHDPDLLLLGSNAAWGAERYSCFAGFGEAGEALEATVVREVREESGIEVSELEYRGSQAWPYPRSLMIGFFARAIDDAAARPDGDEIVAVRWFTRDEIGAGLAGEGSVLLPGRSSIAHRLIADWQAGAA